MRRSMAVLAVGVALVATGCGGGGAAPRVSGVAPEKPVAQQAAAKPSAKLGVEPADGADGVSPAGPFRVTVADGSLASVALTNSDGKQVAGELAADEQSWVATEPLGYNRTYTWSGTANGADGKDAPISGSFHTVAPKRQVSASLNVGDDQVYGVAMPLAVQFSAPVTDKPAVQKALQVQTSVPTKGAWAWLSDSEVHWRPEEYWKPNTKVMLKALLHGVALGDGAYGLQDVTASFTIGRALIATADTRTHRFVVTEDGRQLFEFPASYGLESDPGRVTRNGTHVVISKSATVSMTNRKYGYEDVVVPWGVQISYNGEYVHGYEGSRWAQGSENVSHGCANLAPENARAYFDEVIPGDPVVVTGSSVPLSAQDGTYYDWALDWNAWTGKSAA
jgi:lipoprotein-anchoring transpeptidase ErfK/SrfK